MKEIKDGTSQNLKRKSNLSTIKDHRLTEEF